MSRALSSQRSLLVCAPAFAASGLRVATAAIVCVSLACGSSSPTTPTPQPPTTPANTLVTGTVVDAFTDQPIPGVTIRPSGLDEVTSSASGAFTLTYPGQTQFAVRDTVFSSPGTVDRSLVVRFPAAAPIRLSLIPKSFDLASFDAMFRSSAGVLRRWLITPTLVVERRVLAYTALTDETFRATGAVMSDADAQSIAVDLSAALPQLSGNTFPAFKEVRIETSAEGAMVSTARQGIIVAAHYAGLEQTSGSIAFGLYYYIPTQEVVQGSILLDAQVDSTDLEFRRRVRIHSLGHALAWSDVNSVPSVMNTAISSDLTEFDRTGSRLAFKRSPGNMTPDRDLVESAINRVPVARQVSPHVK